MRYAQLLSVAMLVACGSEDGTPPTASATGAPKEDQAAAELLGPTFEAIAAYRRMIDPDPEEDVIAPFVGVLAGQEIAKVRVGRGTSPLSVEVVSALGKLSSACRADTTGKPADITKWSPARKKCSEGIVALQLALDELAKNHPAASAFPKVPGPSMVATEKTPLGALMLGGPALKAYRAAFASKTTTAELLKEKGVAALAERTRLAEAYSKGAPEGSGQVVLAELVPLMFEVEHGRTEADVASYRVLVACKLDAKKCEKQQPEICADNKVADTRKLPAFASDYAELRAELCGS